MRRSSSGAAAPVASAGVRRDPSLRSSKQAPSIAACPFLFCSRMLCLSGLVDGAREAVSGGEILPRGCFLLSSPAAASFSPAEAFATGTPDPRDCSNSGMKYTPYPSKITTAYAICCTSE